tara:strand:- start:8882 stop:9184 length:303 start_codon:yes stop_codon:yes gene_type:complete
MSHAVATMRQSASVKTAYACSDISATGTGLIVRSIQRFPTGFQYPGPSAVQLVSVVSTDARNKEIMATQFILELKIGVWIADWEGDPGRSFPHAQVLFRH